jgi:hypothetical protein
MVSTWMDDDDSYPLVILLFFTKAVYYPLVIIHYFSLFLFIQITRHFPLYGPF